MNKTNFKRLLSMAGLNQKQLSVILEISETSVAKWNKEGNSYPSWLEGYLTGYIAKKKIKDLKTFIDEI